MRFGSFLAFVFTATGFVQVSLAGSAGDVGERRDDRTQEVRRLLSEHCFKCHGPDDAERQAELRLDDETSATSELPSGTRGIVPGEPENSEILVRIRSNDPDLQMPPPGAENSLSDEDTALIEQWIRDGAPWQQHWSFQEIQRPVVPSVGGNNDSLNPVDAFIQERLLSSPLQPSPEADRYALLRRVTLDLTGLPPTPEEMRAFVNDQRPDAYERVVDRLLKSPHYGEHQARFWLDAARYGDTHGLHLDNYREIWPYRDWVIRAFNANKPFEEFVIEQLAGDLLPNPDQDQLIATGFNRCNVSTSEGGSIAEEVRMRNVVDRVVTTGTVFLGLTLDCCRCHNHKFDPVTMEDFYSLYAYFNSIDGPPLDGNKKDHAPVIQVITPELQQQIAELEGQRTRRQAELKSFLSGVTYAEPETPTPAAIPDPVEYIWIDDSLPEGATPQGGWQFVKEPAPVYSGSSSSTRTATGLSQHFFDNAAKPLRIGEGDSLFTWVYLDPENPPREIMLQWNTGGWDHRAYWGDNLIDWGVKNQPSRRYLGALPEAGKWIRLEVPADLVGIQPGKEIRGWAFTQFDGRVWWDKAGIVTQQDQEPRYDSLRQWVVDKSAAEWNGVPAEVATAGRVAEAERTEQQQRQLLSHFLRTAYAPIRDQVIAADKEIREFKERADSLRQTAPTTLVYREKATPEKAFMLHRGEYDQPQDEVTRRTPEALPPIPESFPNDRLGLAQWLVSDSNPLTARVTVNRLWQRFFGTGLVKTTEDFGSQGERPSHPELLDWLASEFRSPEVEGAAHRWDIRHIVRLIVTSATYRQSAAGTAESFAADPENRLLSRGPRYRLDAEVIRDQALAVSGLLVPAVGGPPVKPPQPDGLWFAVGYSGSNTVRFEADEGSDKIHRRTVYTFIKRTAPPPQMSTLDGPSREACVVRRERTNSPMQALMLMNDPQFVECARALAQSVLTADEDGDRGRLQAMLETAVLRPVETIELQMLEEDLNAFRQEFGEAPEQAAALNGVGMQAVPEAISAEELAAWTMVANIVLNLDEVLNK